MEIPLFQCNEVTLANFLSNLAQTNSFSTVAAHRAAITTWRKASGESWTESTLIERVMKGIFRKNPPKPRYAKIWDVSIVLSYVKSLGENGKMGLKSLSRKTAMLCALAAPKRSSELCHLTLNLLKTKESSWEFTIPGMTKNRGMGKAHSAVLERFQEDELLCPVITLEAYIK
ncbi:unnamed protein product, partial [Caenorhabditis auriculariae]